ncbi:MAG TPA: hypothetical protein PLF92_04165 [Arenimonas sp.]|nr:hypothetical protein [Arenimonas sp.]HOZ04568.1 hypothetical protein [Arenimonas sp.]HPO24338.1 hypothetical protein [Arenimonas sp.]HPW32083.1 hypothetical protein [Arenimonas sp.]
MTQIRFLAFAVLVLCIFIDYLYRIHEEDAALLLAFGDSYRSYCQHTERLVPWLY